MRGRHSLTMIWRWPLLLAILSVFGLFSALIGQHGVWLLLSWLALATPLAVVGLAVCRGRARSAKRTSIGRPFQSCR